MQVSHKWDVNVSRTKQETLGCILKDQVELLFLPNASSGLLQGALDAKLGFPQLIGR
jgi:hypothetical protein